MTIALNRRGEVAVRDPSELVDAETWETVTTYLAKHMAVTKAYAERMFGQTLVFLKASVDSRRDPAHKGFLMPDGRRYRVVPDHSVDPGWHAFLQHSELYTRFCQSQGLGFIHHRPYLAEEMLNGTALEATVAAVRATGYRVDLEFWSSGTSCCPPECNDMGG